MAGVVVEERGGSGQLRICFFFLLAAQTKLCTVEGGQGCPLGKVKGCHERASEQERG